MKGGEIFVPKIPSMTILDLAKTIAPDCEIKTIGIRPGEKLHEVLITEDDARSTIEEDSRYVILGRHESDSIDKTKLVAESFSYSSDSNTQKLSTEELETLLNITLPKTASSS